MAEMTPEEVQSKFEALAGLEKDFEQADLEILRETIKKQAPLFERRNAITDSFPGFWAHVFEACSTELGLDEHINIEDMMVIASLSSLKVTRPDVEEPRNIEFSLTFDENDYCEACTATKKFTYLPGRGDGEAGTLVSEPVSLKWKPNKDLTSGVNKLAIEAFAERKEASKESGKGKGKQPKRGKAEEKLLAVLEKTTSSSFFNWLSYTGQHEFERGETEEDDNDEDAERPVEPFPYGEEVAIQIAEDLWVGAVKYFTSSIEDENEDDGDSDVDLDSELEEQLLKGKKGGSSKKSKRNGDDADGDEPAKKKSKK